MSRVLWFTLGALAGTAYASRLISREKLDLAIGESRPVTDAKSMVADYKGQLRGYQGQLADMVEQQSTRMGEMLSERGHTLAASIRGVTFLEEGQAEEKREETPMPQVIGGRDDMAM